MCHRFGVFPGSFLFSLRRWNLNEVEQQQPVGNKTASILDVALVKSPTNAFPFSMSLHEGLHWWGCGFLSLFSCWSHVKACKRRFDDITEVGCVGHCAGRLGSHLLNTTQSLQLCLEKGLHENTGRESSLPKNAVHAPAISSHSVSSGDCGLLWLPIYCTWAYSGP